MRIHLLAVGRRMPRWVHAGYDDYARRLPPECSLLLVEIPPARRTRTGEARRALAREGELLLRAIPDAARVVALDERGAGWRTRELAHRLSHWMQEGRDLALLVGGPDGLAPACLERADARWSLSPLTLPHGLARIIVAEQIYRAWSLLHRHPYHRG
ncbi:MAG: 23S rRNA (pseudouridine(1915)-N(3))-methyltransferase RlmH [Gammaproteobacteria bacterium]|nr:23S rRNA (pseudouridine(1915)-N(3))-methyltransferase RlmH [Gammaproteobacteria bacterium]NIR83679.1 23S rRNA (pseudouridine(1915)-N(3))-methyltransferase RlmH [Gammaproteobacteria bacterium]NIR91654.1 23S rRNA (pseudouridine(1915)-N(3))-methyltransferase RlmH [Gammaproteobacteria bacterium]NIU04841.1 23S rRNA (pseudouridine(1915)-N(3))-methyltransferase RlmH [Gammaproteobacteria bacterium]NIV51827.1 23S rRNA (pseudouridine(1915)-N(3))-methyltransferase RlmH [Gammaproteobacteria bacterium]